MERENRLARAASAYLRSARRQPVDWHEWGDEAFARAQREDKPVLLDIGAVWCHWCHVMDRESYEDAPTAALINAEFVAVKVDRDERPDVDSRYQAAVSAISGQGGWPLTAFLTPDGKPFFGGTYFPPEERFGRPSFQRVLQSMAAAYRSRRDEVDESAASVMTAIEQGEVLSGHPGEIEPQLLDRILASMAAQFDPRHGGFGSQPKFHHAGALDLLLDSAMRPGSPMAEQARQVVTVTLDRMAAGGIYDQLGGGFHRYSTDERWVVPHFEKMLYDNSELLRVYVHAFQSFVEPRYARLAADILRWMDDVLSDRERGGFYAAQDADLSSDDDGDYFTWTRAEVEGVLNEEEFAVAVVLYDLRAVGDMHHNPAKNVLRMAVEIPVVAERLQLTTDLCRELAESAKHKLRAARQQRPAPFVDKTIYTGWNALGISAYLAAGRALGLPKATEFALKTLDRVLHGAWFPGEGLRRVVAYGDGVSPQQSVPAVLDDYAQLAMAALDAWEVTGRLPYFQAAAALTDWLLARFYDPVEGGFFDRDHHEGALPVGALSARRKPLQDAPTPAGNAVAAGLLLRLSALTGNDQYRICAVETLRTFAGVAEHLGLNAASYAQALRQALSSPVQVCVVGEDERAEELAAVATARFLLNKSVVRLRPEQLAELPPALAETLPHLPGVLTGSLAVVCKGASCSAPVRDPEALLGELADAV